MLHDLAHHIRQSHGAILSDWIESVRADPNLPSAQALDDAALRDHLDSILLDLAIWLDHSPADAQAGADAARHGQIRWDERYQVDEVVRELAVLRETFHTFYSAYVRHRRYTATDDFLRATQIINRFFDTVSSESVASFVHHRHSHFEHAAQTLGLLNQTLEQSNREFAAVDSSRRRTLRTVAHEMAASVNALGLGLSYLNECDLPQDRHEGERLVNRTVEHLRGMLKQLMDATGDDHGLERLHITDFAIQPLFTYLVSMFKPLAERKGLDFRAVLDDALDDVRSDENKVQRIAINLLSNAIKYCPEGHIALTMCALDGESWVVEVADTGCGIPAKEHERIFQEFERLPRHADEPGLGLGLAIVRSLTHSLGGRLILQSEEGLGSCFRVTLPRRI